MKSSSRNRKTIALLPFYAQGGYKLHMLSNSHFEAVKDFYSHIKIRQSRPTVDFLGRLMRSFLRFPYENLTKIIKAGEESDPVKRLRFPETIIGDHIDFGAGGTCFSLTHFFRKVLENSGFKCEAVLCDRSYGPDTHCALIVEVDEERYLVDPGYLLQHPLKIPIRGDSILKTPFNLVSLTRLGETSQYVLTTTQGGKSTIRYRLKDIPVDNDTFLDRWISSFSWAQMRHVCITKLDECGHIYLRDSHLRHSTIDRQSKEKLKNESQKIIADTFGINGQLIEHAKSYIDKGINR